MQRSPSYEIKNENEENTWEYLDRDTKKIVCLVIPIPEIFLQMFALLGKIKLESYLLQHGMIGYEHRWDILTSVIIVLTYVRLTIPLLSGEQSLYYYLFE